MTETPEKPDGACLLHRPPTEGQDWIPADEGYATCSACLDRLRADLRDISKRYHMLNPRPGANTEHGGRGAPGFGSRSPASDHVIVMRDRRSSQVAKAWTGRDGKVHCEQERPPLSVPGELDTAAWAIAEARHVDGPAADALVPDLVRWIDRHLDWVTRRDDVVELASVIRRLLAQLRPVTGDARKMIGHCPEPLNDTDCGARLYAPTRGDTIHCHTCGTSWPRPEWVRLGLILQSGAA